VANLEISARDIAKQIPMGPGDWQKHVPKSTAKRIVEKKLFGYSE